MSEEDKPHVPHWIAPHPRDESAQESGGMDAPQFAHLAYGELVKHYGRDATIVLKAWDQLSEAEREKFVSAFAVIHAAAFPHGPPAERYPSAQGTKH